MSVALRKSTTLAEFLAWEERQELRWEFDGHEPVAMVGGTAAHSTIQHNLHVAVGLRLRGKPCRFHGSDLKIEVAGSIRYPDGFVVCSPIDGALTVAGEPVVIFEVMSPSIASVDRIVQNQEYRDTASIQRYVMLEQDRPGATVFSRSGDDWVGHVVAGDAILPLPEIGIKLPMADLYEGVAFEEPAADT